MKRVQGNNALWSVALYLLYWHLQMVTKLYRMPGYKTATSSVGTSGLNGCNGNGECLMWLKRQAYRIRSVVTLTNTSTCECLRNLLLVIHFRRSPKLVCIFVKFGPKSRILQSIEHSKWCEYSQWLLHFTNMTGFALFAAEIYQTDHWL